MNQIGWSYVFAFLLSMALQWTMVRGWSPMKTVAMTMSSQKEQQAFQPHKTISTSTNEALSSLSSSSSSRRDFFGTSTKSAAAVAMTTASFLALNKNQPAMAADIKKDGNGEDSSVYNPLPGSLQGKVILITGGTSGLGLESAKRLAAAGATILITGRTQSKGDAAVANIQSYLDEHHVVNTNIYAVPLNLDSLQNVKSFAKRLPSTIMDGHPIDVLINNAGVMAIPKRELTEDGYERTFQSNHLGHFVLTATLAPYLSKDARIINVSSSAYLIVTSPTGPPKASANLDVQHLVSFTDNDYDPWKAYGSSKLENILFTQELQRRIDDTKGRIQWTAVALHPGAVQTNLARYLGVPYVDDSTTTTAASTETTTTTRSSSSSVPFWKQGLLRLVARFIKTVQQGASTQVYLAAVPKSVLHGGAYYEDCHEQPLVPAAQNPSLAKALWDVSEQLGGIKFQF